MIGRWLIQVLRDRGHSPVIISRRSQPPNLPKSLADISWIRVDPPYEIPPSVLEGFDAVVNLAGVRIKGGRWSSGHKKEIFDSRVNTTRNLVKAVQDCKAPPQILVSGSATGYYGDRGDQILTEEAEGGRGFLAEVTQAWEEAALEAENVGVRVVMLRTAPVLSSGDGALPQIINSFKLGFGGGLGPGTQWMPWVHIEDAAGIVSLAIENQAVKGPINVTSPEPKINAEFMREVAEIKGKHLLMNVPSVVLRLSLGEMAEEMLLASQRVMPEKAIATGYRFRFPTLNSALVDLLG